MALMILPGVPVDHERKKGLCRPQLGSKELFLRIEEDYFLFWTHSHSFPRLPSQNAGL